MKQDLKTHAWQQEGHPADFWEKGLGDSVVCRLSPRNCRIPEGGAGFCGVRVNRGGALLTLNYGKSVAATEESIETEAVFHFAPGARILSMGNIGCMMNCTYCHNWQTSQAGYVEDKQVHYYTPEEVIGECLARNIKVISWTYNDPVVWQEFVVSTSRLARQEGIRTLYKSAFYISAPAIEELLEVIDIFSVSLKSMDPEFYRRVTKGRLQPVLDGIRQVHASGRHLELSNLLVTDANDTGESPLKIAEWMLEHLTPEVPLHYVRFHPDYKYTHVDRTPLDRLDTAREGAIELGLKYVYLGNVYDNEAVNTRCPNCGRTLVERYGLRADVVGLTANGACVNCSARVPVREIGLASESQSPAMPDDVLREASHLEFNWHGGINAIHVEVHNPTPAVAYLVAQGVGGSDDGQVLRTMRLAPGHEYRAMVSKSSTGQSGVKLVADRALVVKTYEVFDRAHFPVASTSEVPNVDDRTPSSTFLGMPRVGRR